MAPEDKGENVRREICLTLEQIGITPECSHHEEGPGQNEIDSRYSDALTAADNALLLASTVRAVAVSNGLYADFSPKPIAGEAGNGLHINISLQESEESVGRSFMAGILRHAREMTAFLNSCEASYRRLGEKKAPRYVTWSHQNRSQLIRIPAAQGQYRRMVLGSADPSVNPYLAFALIIYAGLDGVKQGLTPPEPTDLNLYTAEPAVTEHLEVLPGSLSEARRIAGESAFLRSILPEELFGAVLGGNEAVVLLRGNTGQRLEPMGKMGGSFFHRSVLHGVGHHRGHVHIQVLPRLDGGLEGFVSLLGQTGLHCGVVKYHGREDFCNHNSCSPFRNKKGGKEGLWVSPQTTSLSPFLPV